LSIRRPLSRAAFSLLSTSFQSPRIENDEKIKKLSKNFEKAVDLQVALYFTLRIPKEIKSAEDSDADADAENN